MWILKANLVIWLINVVAFGVFVAAGFELNIILNQSFFSKLVLLETGVTFLVGGFFAFSGSALQNKTREHLLKKEEKWSIETLKNKEKRANKYIILAAVLFVQSLVIGFLGV